MLISNTEKSTVLSEVAKTSFITDKEVKDKYMEVAKTLTSNTDYRNAVDRILN